jgi:uncharacterized protein (DUF433 family)
MKLPDFLTEHTYGEICLTGHRIGLYTVMREYKAGKPAAQIAEEYPSLPLDHIEKVLRFYDENRAEVDAYVESYGQELARQASAVSPGPGLLKLRRRMVLLEEADKKHGTDPDWTKLSLTEKWEYLQRQNPTEAL